VLVTWVKKAAGCRGGAGSLTVDTRRERNAFEKC
jgi:hypothetical protein